MTVQRRTRPFPPHAPRLSVRPGEVHLWALRPPPDGGEPRAVGELDAGERRRAAAFPRPGGRLAYLHAHIGVRRLLSVYTGVPPALLPLDRASCPGCGDTHGRPVLRGRHAGLHFSLSHSHGLVLYGVAGAPVGVDVQRVPGGGTVELCLPRLHPREQREIRALPDAVRPRAFAELWSRKEAYLKGLGTGLCRGAGEDYLGAYPATGGDRPPDGWLVSTLHGCPDHVAAFALAATTGHRAALFELPDHLTRWSLRKAAEEIAEARPALRMVLPAPPARAPAGGPAGRETER